MPPSPRLLATLLLTLSALCSPGSAAPAPTPDAPPASLYQNPAASVDARTDDLLRQLTLDEKIRLLGGTGFTTQPVARLGWPAFVMSDGPVGVHNFGPTTAYAAGISLAASFDDALAQRVGVGLGRDGRSRGVHILLGPGMNLYRAPLAGRNFEYFGEDPLLSGKIAAAYIRGVQSQGVAATPKHFAVNNQEFSRHLLSSDLDEPTLRELYTRNFLIAVRDGQPRCVMTSCNPVNGVHASQNHHLITDLLRDSLGFEGFVMSDWDSCHDPAGMALAGLDLEMPYAVQYTPEKMHALLDSKQLTPEVIDGLVRSQLRVCFELGWLDRPQEDPAVPRDDPTSAAVALDEARAGIVLLKNKDHLLPLDQGKLRRLVVVGPNADHPVTGGGGSSYTEGFHALSLVDGLKQVIDDPTKIVSLDWKLGSAPSDEAQQTMRDADAVVVSVGFDWTGVRNAGPDSHVPIPIERYDGYPPQAEGEGGDRAYTLPPGTAEMIAQVAAVNPRAVVILNAGGSVETASWIEHAAGLLHAFYPGQAGAAALAEILFGQTNPSGKLPFSWEKRWEDSAAYGHYPTRANPTANDYQEGIFLGYRWFDAKGIAPLFPFGFGLSYTNFALSDFRAARNGTGGQVEFMVTVRNTGPVAGAEVVQIYVDQASERSSDHPPHELKAYGKVFLAPNEQQTLTLLLNPADLAHWDSAAHRWSAVAGTYRFQAGESSRLLTLHTTLSL